MSRFFVHPENIGAGTIEITDSGDLHHMRKVLRLRSGDEVDVSDSQRFEYKTVIEIIEEDRALLRIVDKQAFSTEPKTRVTLYQGIPKQGKMESIIQKSVELGVHEIVPVFTERTVVVDKGNTTKKTARWNKISSEAVKQCRRGLIPRIREPLRLPEVIKELEAYDLVLIPYENEEDKTIKHVLRECEGPHIAVMIGPEGGFSTDEVEAVIDAGGNAVTLGKTTLRTETAGPTALAMIMYELEL